jgi:hypothetical protein
LVPAEGFEPPTYGLQNRCTTTVLSRHFNNSFYRGLESAGERRNIAFSLPNGPRRDIRRRGYLPALRSFCSLHRILFTPFSRSHRVTDPSPTTPGTTM